MRVQLLVMLLLLHCAPAYLEGARLKDLAKLRGERDNQLSGYGLVVGLAGSGDKGFDLANQSLVQILRTLGVNPKTPGFDSKNVAAVLCTAILPPFARQGSRIGVLASSIGSASSLEGGTLMMTALRGPDGQVYAMAQGKILTIRRGGGGGKGGDQTAVTAEIRGGALLEKELKVDLGSRRELRYQLHSPDFTTAARIAKRVNQELAGKYATALDAGTVDVIFPYTHDAGAVELIAQIENIDVEADQKAKVVVNARTGTVVLGGEVKLLPVALAHDNLKIEVKGRAPAAAPEAPQGAAPGANAAAATLDAGAGSKSLAVLPQSATLSDLVAGLNEMGTTADDLISVLHALKASGALIAELEII